MTETMERITECESLNVLLKRHGYDNIYRERKTYRGVYELRTRSKNTRKMPQSLIDAGWKKHSAAILSEPRNDVDGNAYWNANFRFSHPEHGKITIAGTITLVASPTNIFATTRQENYSNTIYFRPKKNK